MANEAKMIELDRLLLNDGQIDGLPKNPRFIKDEKFESLKKSIKDAPEMLNLRELIVFPFNDKFIVIGGNMRLNACRELGFSSVPCKVLPADTPVKKLREYTIKDNNGYGEWDKIIIDSSWDSEELEDWGLDGIASDFDGNVDDLFEDYEGEQKEKLDFNITITLPNDLKEKEDTIIEMVKDALSDFNPVVKGN